MMAIVLVESPNQLIERENQVKELEDAKTDSKLLALDDKYMQVKIYQHQIHFICF